VKVLLVSANPRINSVVRTALIGREEIDFLEVATPERAVQQIDEHGDGAFDIVVADNDMHPTGGFFLAREIKARGQMGRAMPPVVLLLAREHDVWLSNWSQADAYVVKPVDPFDLAETIEALVEGEPVPALPRIGGDPTPSLLDLPGDTEGGEAAGLIGGAAGGVTGGGT
jgi:DNA-binding response OmpR family regulator